MAKVVKRIASPLSSRLPKYMLPFLHIVFKLLRAHCRHKALEPRILQCSFPKNKGMLLNKHNAIITDTNTCTYRFYSNAANCPTNVLYVLYFGGREACVEKLMP